MATSEVSICNQGMQKLGAKRFTSLSDTTVLEARECNACYEALRDAELRKHNWNFAITRVALAADTTEPAFGPANQYSLPSDFLRLLPPDPQYDLMDLDWKIEGRKILTNDDAPLYVRYVRKVEDPNEFDALFVEVLACAIAVHTAEKITQSNAKKEAAAVAYKNAVNEAKRANGIENVPHTPPADEWDVARL